MSGLYRTLAVSAAALTLVLVGAGPALAATPTPSPSPVPSSGASPQQATPTERAAAEVRPAIVYVTEKFTAYVADETGTYFNNGNPYELTATCTGFGVNPNGYVATAGHCIDTYSPNGIKGDFIAAVAKEVVATVPGVTLEQAVKFGTENWTVEGTAKGSAIDTEIAVVTGTVQGGGKPQVLPARVVDARGLTQGDVALLKVETTDLPSVELATDADVQVGTPLLSIGYPASADAVTDPSLEPSNKDGQVSAKKTVGSVPVYETSAALTPGMSGGPTVDLEGRVLGINSFMPAGESQAFNFVAPASGLTELLSRNGVRNELGPDDKAFRAALDAYYTGHYTDAITGFDKLLQVAPQHAQAVQYRTLAAKARDRFGDVPVAPAPAAGPSPVLFWSIVGGGAAVAVGLAVLLTVLVRRRGRGTTGATLPVALPPTPLPGYGPVPGQTMPAGADKVMVPWGAGAPTADYRMVNGPVSGPVSGGAVSSGPGVGGPVGGLVGGPVGGGPVDGPVDGSAGVISAQREDCARCGTRMAAEARFCPTCGNARG
jgi:serine protease Do